jgi:hypothetical protein
VIETVYKEIVLAGKKSKKFIDLGVEKGRSDAKHSDPNNLDESGSITINDAKYLHKIVSAIKPSTIVEIGTWFGTSAVIMADACKSAKIYTCDKHNVYVENNPYSDRIFCLNMLSKGFLAKLIEEKIFPEFIFIDAKIKDGDEKMICKFGCNKIAVHDWNTGGKKGRHNINAILKKRKYNLILPPEGTDIAVLSI